MKVTTARLTAVALALGGVVAAAPNPVEAKGPINDTFAYGFFYGTFDESPNIALFAGGTLEDFCLSDPDLGPGTAPLRVFPRKDGSTDLKVNAKGQRIYLYETEFNDIPEWLGEVCPGIAGDEEDPPQPFAEGTANLKVRITANADMTTDVFNSVNGKAQGTDGTRYKVRGTADLVVDADGVPQGDPRDFVGFKLREIGGR